MVEGGECRDCFFQEKEEENGPSAAIGLEAVGETVFGMGGAVQWELTVATEEEEMYWGNALQSSKGVVSGCEGRLSTPRVSFVVCAPGMKLTEEVFVELKFELGTKVELPLPVSPSISAIAAEILILPASPSLRAWLVFSAAFLSPTSNHIPVASSILRKRPLKLRTVWTMVLDMEALSFFLALT